MYILKSFSDVNLTRFENFQKEENYENEIKS